MRNGTVAYRDRARASYCMMSFASLQSPATLKYEAFESIRRRFDGNGGSMQTETEERGAGGFRIRAAVRAARAQRDKIDEAPLVPPPPRVSVVHESDLLQEELYQETRSFTNGRVSSAACTPCSTTAHALYFYFFYRTVSAPTLCLVASILRRRQRMLTMPTT